ncbi:hypothetical protein BsWGS_16721 [Bradybaena similaris]
MESGISAEVHFAQKLAANEKKTRDRAIKRLNKYLSVRSRHASGLSEPDLLKIWKGLFYCMWMQDKPLIQEELSQRITNLLHCFPKTEDGLRFVKVFLETMSREWNGIDRLRLDKFMMMFRDMLHQTFVLLSKGDWQEDDCRTLALSVYQHVMCANEPRLPDGLKLHLADIFLYELTKVSTEQLTSKVLLILLQPFIEFVLLTNKMDLAHRVTSQIIYKVMKVTSSSSEAAEDEDVDDAIADEADQVDENMDVEVSHQQKTDQPPYPLDKVVFLKLLFDLAGRKVIRASNRALVYKLVKKYSEIWDSSGSCASGAEQTSGVELDESGNEEVHNFVCDVRFLKHDGKAVDQQQVGQQSKKRKKKRKKEEYSDCNTIPGSIGSDVAAESSVAVEKKTVKVKKSRLKHKNVVSVTQEDDDSQSKRQSPGNKNTLKAISDQNNSAVDCARVTSILSRKRKRSPDESEDSPAKRKKLRLDSESTLTDILARKTPKKTNNCTGEIPIYELSEEETLAVDIETNTNYNAKPKYRGASPPKSTPEACVVELVKYNTPSSSVVKKDTSVLQAKSSSPKTRTYLVSSVERSNDTNVSEQASLPLEKQPALSNHDGSLGFNKTSPSAEKVRVKSEPPKSKLADRKLPVFQEVMYPAMSVPIGLVMTTPHGSREEATAGPSGLSFKKKVIFDLRRNKANKFQDYLKSLAKQPEPPYEPTKSPAVGILKSPVISPAVSTTSSETSQLPSKKGGAFVRRTSASSILVKDLSKKKKSLFNAKGHKQHEQPSSGGKGKKKHKA